MTALKIDLYTDIICPWCLIGNHRLDKVLAERFAGLSFDIEHHPVLLMPDLPAEGADTVELLTQRMGVFDRAAFFGRPEAAARESGLMLDLGRQPRMAPTVAAHSLIRNARHRGTQHRLAVAIGQAHFDEVRDIGDVEVLADIGAEYGFDRDEARALVQSPGELALTLAEARQAAAQGIRGVPHFIFGGTVSVSGGQSEDALSEAIRSAGAKITA